MVKTKNKFSTLALTSLAILTLAACQKQETSSASQPASTTSVVKQTTPSSTASSSQKADTTKTSTSAKKTVASSSKTPSASSATKAASTVTTEQAAPAQSAGTVNQSEVAQPLAPVSQTEVIQAPVEAYAVAEANEQPAQQLVQETTTASELTGIGSYVEPTQEEAEQIVQQMLAELPQRVAEYAEARFQGLGGSYGPVLEAEMTKQGYWEKFYAAAEELKNAQNQ